MIDDMQDTINAQTSLLKEKDNAITEQQDTINTQTSLLMEKDNILQQKNDMLKQQTDEIAALKQQLARLQAKDN